MMSENMMMQRFDNDWLLIVELGNRGLPVMRPTELQQWLKARRHFQLAAKLVCRCEMCQESFWESFDRVVVKDW
jgi:hypothetical protein